MKEGERGRKAFDCYLKSYTKCQNVSALLWKGVYGKSCKVDVIDIKHYNLMWLMLILVQTTLLPFFFFFPFFFFLFLLPYLGNYAGIYGLISRIRLEDGSSWSNA